MTNPNLSGTQETLLEELEGLLRFVDKFKARAEPLIAQIRKGEDRTVDTHRIGNTVEDTVRLDQLPATEPLMAPGFYRYKNIPHHAVKVVVDMEAPMGFVSFLQPYQMSEDNPPRWHQGHTLAMGRMDPETFRSLFVTEDGEVL